MAIGGADDISTSYYDSQIFIPIFIEDYRQLYLSLNNRTFH